MVLALSKNGTLYKFPISKELQLKNNTPEISYHQMKPDNLGYFEKYPHSYITCSGCMPTDTGSKKYPPALIT